MVVGGTAATESGVIRDASQAFEALAFGGGVVAGHWWINRERPVVEGPLRFALLVGLGIAAAAVSLISEAPTSVYLGAGLLSGHLLWPMERKS